MSLEGYCSNDTLYLKYKDYRGKIPYKEVMQKPDEIKLLMDFINGSQKTKYESVNDNLILTTTIPSGLTEKTIKVELLGIDTYFKKIDRLEKKLDTLTKLLKEKEDNINVGEFTVKDAYLSDWCKEYKPFIYSMTCKLIEGRNVTYLIKAQLYCNQFHKYVRATSSQGYRVRLNKEVKFTEPFTTTNNDITSNEYYIMKLTSSDKLTHYD